jgi:opacity protein-like surface antigen
MEIPTARVLKENRYRLGFSQVKPYRYYYGAISPFKGLEVDLRITEVLNVPAFNFPSGNFRDKAVDVKYQFLSEGKYFPALAIGFMDPHGTRIYPSQYLAASKQIYPLDFTVGLGNGRFGTKPLPAQNEGIELEMFGDAGEWFRDSGVFGGIQFAPSDKFALMFEYSPIKYHKQTKDPAQNEFFRDPVSSRYNIGLRYKPADWAEVDLSYQRGREIGFNMSLAFDIGDPIIPIYDPVYREVPSSGRGPVPERMTRALFYSGFSDIRVEMEGDELWITAQNDRYYYSTKAIGVIMNIIITTAPEDIEKVHIILKENGIAQYELSSVMADMSDLYAGKLGVREFLYLSEVSPETAGDRDIQGLHKKSFRYGIRPSLETFLNDPSGFFKYRLGLSGWVSYNPWKGAAVISGIEGYPVNNISSVNEPLSIPVRSDIVLYKRKKTALGRLMFDQIYKAGYELYGRVSAGYLEIQYAGLDAEIAKPVLDGRILLGLSGSIVKKRDPERPFGLKSDDVKEYYTPAFINARVNIPEMDIAIDLQAGRFLAGDNGVRFTLSKFINGVILKAWYTVTDTSVFNDEHNEGYSDKGLSISIPIRLFTGSDSKTVYHFSLTPWTRDTGQDIAHFSPLFDFIGRNTKIFIDKDREMIYR